MARMVDLTLTVAVATIGTRIAAMTADSFPPVPGVTYHIFAQNLPPGATAPRADIGLTALAGTGVARSRNAALAAVTTDLLLFADDDLTLLSQNYVTLVRAFAADPTLDVLCGRVLTPDGRPRKAYGTPGPQSRWTTGKFGTPEIALRVARIRAIGVQFDDGFGAGAPVPIGDEYIFLADCLRHGAHVAHQPVDLAVHAAESSGTVFTPASFAHRKRVLNRALGGMAPVGRAGFAWRHRRRFPGLADVLRFILP
jgi:Glycosyl transferase family 2